MKRYLTFLICVLLLSSCDDREATIPSGFEYVSRDNRSHFLYVQPNHLGEKIAQREAGRIICKEVFKQEDYCEVYYFATKSAVPTKFPILNRLNPVGYFEMKNGKEKFKVLSDSTTSTVYKGE